MNYIKESIKKAREAQRKELIVGGPYVPQSLNKDGIIMPAIARISSVDDNGWCTIDVRINRHWSLASREVFVTNLIINSVSVKEFDQKSP